MKTENGNESAFESLREQAEKVVRQRGAKTSDGDELEWLRLLNEIEVYQVELELQNQELNRSTKELEAARNDYFDLYDSAPVAYVTLDGDGMIQRKNKAAERLTAKSGNLPEGSLFARAVHPADQSAFFFLSEQKRHGEKTIFLRDATSEKRRPAVVGAVHSQIHLRYAKTIRGMATRHHRCDRTQEA